MPVKKFYAKQIKDQMVPPMIIGGRARGHNHTIKAGETYSFKRKRDRDEFMDYNTGLFTIEVDDHDMAHAIGLYDPTR